MMAGGLAEIVARCLAGDGTAQKDLYAAFVPRVFRLAVRMVGPDDAPDVTQQVFLKVFRGLSGFRGDANFSTWLYRIAVNECLQHIRRNRRKAQRLPNELVDRAREFDRQIEQAELLKHALASLDEQLRAVFVLREVEGLSYEQIAQALEIPAGTVASQLRRARNELRKHLTNVLSE